MFNSVERLQNRCYKCALKTEELKYNYMTQEIDKYE